MSTLDTSSRISKLQSYISGDRNMFIFLKSDSDLPTKHNEVINFLVHCDKIGYGFQNAQSLLTLSKSDFNRFKTEFESLLENSSKDGIIFRKSFGLDESLTTYTIEDIEAIIAQYSITYGWAEEFAKINRRSAEDILSSYVGSMSDTITDLSIRDKKIMKIGYKSDLIKLLTDIVESPVILRAQQIETLKATPTDILSESCENANIKMKETLIKVTTLLKDCDLNFPILRTSTDVLRYVIAAYAHEPYEGQILKSDLKSVKLRIPTSIRKKLLHNLELIAELSKNGSKHLTEDMFVYDMFWKRLDKYLRYESSVKTRIKFPLYTQAIDLLYENDRSWTFNGRFSNAKSNLDYDLAIRVAAERPGFLMRNLMDFLRMTKGVKLPVKENSKPTEIKNVFTDALSGTKQENTINSVISDASEFLLSDKFDKILDKNLNVKLAWQLLENLKNPDIFKEVHTRVVQNIEIKYSVPLHGLNPYLTKKVRKKILKLIKKKLRNQNSKIGSVYMDDDSASYRLQYSGRSSTELSYAGEFLTPGSELSLSEIIKQKGIENPFIRLGVMWRGLKVGQSVDLDHSSTFNHGGDLYYGKPELISNGTLIGASSGDITTCGGPDSKFSTELIDVDYNNALNCNIREFYNSLIVYSGSTSCGQLETYFFFSIIDAPDRILKNKMTIDLAKTDYAIRIDPDNTDNTGSYIGIHFDLKNDKVKVLCSPIKQSCTGYSNVKSNKLHFVNAMNEFDNHLSIGYAVKKSLEKIQRADDATTADIVISRKSRDVLNLNDSTKLLHPGRDMETINKIIL